MGDLDAPCSSFMAGSAESLGSDGRKDKLPISGLTKEWEREEDIRNHLREEGATFFKEGAEPSVKFGNPMPI